MLAKGALEGSDMRIYEIGRRSFRIYAKQIMIILGILVLIYLLISLYFINHFFLNTRVNGVNLSLIPHKSVDKAINEYINNYELRIIEKNGDTEMISGAVIGLKYNDGKGLSKIYKKQKPYLWIASLFKNQSYHVPELYHIQMDKLEDTMNRLSCLNKNMKAPRNVRFVYSEGIYKAVAEEYGNTILRPRLKAVLEDNILKGNTSVDLSKEQCYEEPRFTINSVKAKQTLGLLNKYIKTKIIYQFGERTEKIDAAIINKWIKVDENLDIIFNKTALTNYVKGLSAEYDTVGITRDFITSSGNKVQVSGGLYGWKINQEAEIIALYHNLKQGETIIKEPVYTQRALARDNEIGNTYVEINITKQHLWFYKDGKVLVHGDVVTGNPNRGYATVLGTYMIIYKQKNAILTGPGYEAKVTYWMPFFGNMGVHDAKWRSAFGGEIYKRRGSHGCVNSPYYLAKTIFENIEEGTPVIVYEE